MVVLHLPSVSLTTKWLVACNISTSISRMTIQSKTHSDNLVTCKYCRLIRQTCLPGRFLLASPSKSTAILLLRPSRQAFPSSSATNIVVQTEKLFRISQSQQLCIEQTISQLHMTSAPRRLLRQSPRNIIGETTLFRLGSHSLPLRISLAAYSCCRAHLNVVWLQEAVYIQSIQITIGGIEILQCFRIVIHQQVGTLRVTLTRRPTV